MSNKPAEIQLLPRNPGKSQSRHWRIEDRDIPWQVASQQSLPPFLPATELHLNASEVSTIGHRSDALKNPRRSQN